MQNRPMTGTTPGTEYTQKDRPENSNFFPSKVDREEQCRMRGAGPSACSRSRKCEFQSKLEPSGSGASGIKIILSGRTVPSCDMKRRARGTYS